MTASPSPARYDEMRYNRCGRSGLKLPAISLGLWHNFGGVDTFENARAMVRDLPRRPLDASCDRNWPHTGMNSSSRPRQDGACGPARTAILARANT